ncbi:phosphoesterase, putative [Methanothrix thermoacetophila PT]|uniref:Phosphoesterase, putative n=2 Tax=Methanotrichaceae TaxID=143067 RepID=A0B6K1_METTP|nr:phosphoesterase, putative [Methanothrix thermoacetophila PT]
MIIEDLRDHLMKRFDFLLGSLYIKETETCVLSDIHIGLEEELLAQGLVFPLREKEELLRRIEIILAKLNPKRFVLAGDVVHSFGRADQRIRRKLDAILNTIRSRCDLVLISGTHDGMLPYMGFTAQSRYDEGGYTVSHGDEDLRDHGHLIMGHEHPVLDVEMMRIPCYLFGRGPMDGMDIMVLPAFNPLCQGVAVNHLEAPDLLSPLLRRLDIGKLHPVVEMEGEVMVFPEIRHL